LEASNGSEMALTRPCNWITEKQEDLGGGRFHFPCEYLKDMLFIAKKEGEEGEENTSFSIQVYVWPGSAKARKLSIGQQKTSSCSFTTCHLRRPTALRHQWTNTKLHTAGGIQSHMPFRSRGLVGFLLILAGDGRVGHQIHGQTFRRHHGSHPHIAASPDIFGIG